MYTVLCLTVERSDCWLTKKWVVCWTVITPRPRVSWYIHTDEARTLQTWDCPHTCKALCHVLHFFSFYFQIARTLLAVQAGQAAKPFSRRWGWAVRGEFCNNTDFYFYTTSSSSIYMFIPCRKLSKNQDISGTYRGRILRVSSYPACCMWRLLVQRTVTYFQCGHWT